VFVVFEHPDISGTNLKSITKGSKLFTASKMYLNQFRPGLHPEPQTTGWWEGGSLHPSQEPYPRLGPSSLAAGSTPKHPENRPKP